MKKSEKLKMSRRKGSLKYYKEHKQECLERHKRYIQRIKAENSLVYHNILERAANFRFKKLRELRKEIFHLLGNKCSLCGFSDSRALQIDHVGNEGRKETLGKNRIRFLKNVLDSIKRKEGKYQLLCANCNFIKEFERRKKILEEKFL